MKLEANDEINADSLITETVPCLYCNNSIYFVAVNSICSKFHLLCYSVFPLRVWRDDIEQHCVVNSASARTKCAISIPLRESN